MAIRPLENIARQLYGMKSTAEHDGGLQAPVQLMEFPLDTVKEFRLRMGWVQPVRTPSFPQFSTPNFYMNDGSPLVVPVTTSSEYMPYGENLAFRYSTEDLSLAAPESGPNSAISPLQLSSPFANPYYLSIPSPSYGGYSPASSTFGDFGEASSIVYSDTDEYGQYDVGQSTTPPMLGNSQMYGAGFVPPIQTVFI
jgi:hypothetical protein